MFLYRMEIGKRILKKGLGNVKIGGWVRGGINSNVFNVVVLVGF